MGAYHFATRFVGFCDVVGPNCDSGPTLGEQDTDRSIRWWFACEKRATACRLVSARSLT